MQQIINFFHVQHKCLMEESSQIMDLIANWTTLLLKKNNLKDSYEYRQYLINNGEALIEANRTTNAAQNGCESCVNLNKDTLPGMPSCDDPKNKYENLN